MKPVLTSHLTELTRALTEPVNDPKHQFNKYTSDFELYHVGSFCEEKGIISAFEKPVFILNLTELKNPSTKEQK